MSQCKFITGFLLIFLLYGCHKSKIPNVYFPGVVLIKANEDYQNGLIQVLDVFSEEEGIEASSRAILFEFNGNEFPLDLNDTVLFKIKECKDLNVLIAYDIKKGPFKIKDFINAPTSSNHASLDQIYAMKTQYKINLHLADNHREGPKHRKKHLRPPKVLIPMSLTGGDPNYREVVLVNPENPADTIDAIIYDPDDVDTGVENVYFFSIREGDTIPTYTWDIYNVSETHDHIIE